MHSLSILFLNYNSSRRIWKTQRERHQNLRIRGVSEKVSDNNIRSFLLGLFNSLAPEIADINWHMDRSLAPKPPVGARPHDIMVRFHYNESKEALTRHVRLVFYESNSYEFP